MCMLLLYPSIRLRVYTVAKTSNINLINACIYLMSKKWV